MPKSVSVALENTAYYFDKLYDYALPESLENKAKTGMRVLVPFGRGNKQRQGIIIAFSSASSEPLKEVLCLIDDEPYLSEEMTQLIPFLKDRCFCPYYDAVRAILPKGINYSTFEFLSAVPKSGEDSDGLTSEARSIYNYLCKIENGESVKKICKDFSLDEDAPALKELIKKGFVSRDNRAEKNMNDASERMVKLSVDEEQFNEIFPLLTPKQKSVAAVLKDAGTASVKEILYFCGVTEVVIKGLLKKGMAEIYEREVYRSVYDDATAVKNEKIVLSKAQRAAYNKISKAYKEKNEAMCALLFGVTGSGKTQVYLKLIDDAIAAEKQVIVLVPEISLTPQTIAIFRTRYGSEVAVYHSKLSMGQRMDEWKRMKRNEAKIVVGTRSAIFAPFQNLGLIIIDEEQEHTYKSEMTPRYSTLDVAKFRSGYNKSLLVLSSATPSIETYSNALSGRYLLAEIPERYGAAELPEVITADMRGEKDETGNPALISRRLDEALKENFKKKEQSILLLNRRGYNTFVACNSCGTVITCPNCSISMTYHRANNRIMCHYCGYSSSLDIECPECHQHDIRYSGCGTQKIEAEIAKSVPEAKILRMDMDTTLNRQSHEKMLSAFAAGEYDILVGTQMVAKGLDFPNVTLAAVVNADQSLYNYDYRSVETTFDLIMQVVGRSGRGEKKGIAVIQTQTPDNPIIALAAKQDYKSFYETESEIRKLMVYPPYCDLCLVGFVSAREENALGGANKFLSELKIKNQSAYREQKLIVLGPAPAKVVKANNKYRYRLIIKCKNSHRFREMIREILCKISSDKEMKNTTVFADINPVDIM